MGLFNNPDFFLRRLGSFLINGPFIIKLIFRQKGAMFSVNYHQSTGETLDSISHLRTELNIGSRTSLFQ